MSIPHIKYNSVIDNKRAELMSLPYQSFVLLSFKFWPRTTLHGLQSLSDLRVPFPFQGLPGFPWVTAQSFPPAAHVSYPTFAIPVSL